MSPSDNRIWKFLLHLEDTQQVEMPAGAQLLHLGVQSGQPCLWAIVTPGDKVVKRTIHCVGTGNPMPPGPLAYLGTTQHANGVLIFHWFEPL